MNKALNKRVCVCARYPPHNLEHRLWWRLRRPLPRTPRCRYPEDWSRNKKSWHTSQNLTQDQIRPSWNVPFTAKLKWSESHPQPVLNIYHTCHAISTHWLNLTHTHRRRFTHRPTHTDWLDVGELMVSSQRSSDEDRSIHPQRILL